MPCWCRLKNRLHGRRMVPVTPVAYKAILDPGIYLTEVSFVSSSHAECILVYIFSREFLLCENRLTESAGA